MHGPARPGHAAPGPAAATAPCTFQSPVHRPSPTNVSPWLRVSRQGTSIRSSRQRKRSEEHTSELQSLMRISYAVFCLKKKKIHHYRQANSFTTQLSHDLHATLV